MTITKDTVIGALKVMDTGRVKDGKGLLIDAIRERVCPRCGGLMIEHDCHIGKPVESKPTPDAA